MIDNSDVVVTLWDEKTSKETIQCSKLCNVTWKRNYTHESIARMNVYFSQFSSLISDFYIFWIGEI